MADYVDARVTNYLENALNGVAMYGGTTTVGLERHYININDRYPYIEIAGPYADVITETDQSIETVLQYAIRYFVNVNDESFTENTEITYLTRTVTEDITKAIMANQTISNLVENIEIDYQGYSNEIIDQTLEFMVYVVVEITVLINRTNPELVI